MLRNALGLSVTIQDLCRVMVDAEIRGGRRVVWPVGIESGGSPCSAVGGRRVALRGGLASGCPCTGWLPAREAGS